MLNLKKYIALFFAICFLSMITAPTIINSIDKSVDVSIFFSFGEEDDNEVFKLTFENDYSEIDFDYSKNTDLRKNIHQINHYQKPFLNLVSPPPDVLI